MGYDELLRLACNDEQAFLKVVQEESVAIPASVKMFLADQIRNALMGEKKSQKAKIIEKALAVVGI